MKTKVQVISRIKKNPELIYSLLEDVANDFETEGCESCGTVSTETINKVREILGWDKLDDIETDIEVKMIEDYHEVDNDWEDEI